MREFRPEDGRREAPRCRGVYGPGIAPASRSPLKSLTSEEPPSRKEDGSRVVNSLRKEHGMSTHLSPKQKSVYEGLKHGLSVGDVFVCWGETGMGKTTILQELHREVGGVLLTMNDFIDAIRAQNPAAI